MIDMGALTSLVILFLAVLSVHAYRARFWQEPPLFFYKPTVLAEDDEGDEEGILRGYACQVAGESFDNEDGTSRQAIIARLSPGMPVTFVPEPSNPYDKNAVAVFTPYGQIGYLPRAPEESGFVRDWMRRGVSFSAQVHAKGRPHGSRNYGVVLDVWQD